MRADRPAYTPDRPSGNYRCRRCATPSRFVGSPAYRPDRALQTEEQPASTCAPPNTCNSDRTAWDNPAIAAEPDSNSPDSSDESDQSNAPAVAFARLQLQRHRYSSATSPSSRSEERRVGK